MQESSYSTVLGVFHNQSAAHQAQDALYQAGFEARLIDDASHASGGFFEDLKNLFTGPSTTQSPSDLPQALLALQLPYETEQYYAEEYRQGHSILLVNAHGHAQEAIGILTYYGAFHAQAPMRGAVQSATDAVPAAHASAVPVTDPQGWASSTPVQVEENAGYPNPQRDTEPVSVVSGSPYASSYIDQNLSDTPAEDNVFSPTSEAENPAAEAKTSESSLDQPEIPWSSPEATSLEESTASQNLDDSFHTSETDPGESEKTPASSEEEDSFANNDEAQGENLDGETTSEDAYSDASPLEEAAADSDPSDFASPNFEEAQSDSLEEPTDDVVEPDSMEENVNAPESVQSDSSAQEETSSGSDVDEDEEENVGGADEAGSDAFEAEETPEEQETFAYAIVPTVNEGARAEVGEAAPDAFVYSVDDEDVPVAQEQPDTSNFSDTAFADAEIPTFRQGSYTPEQALNTYSPEEVQSEMTPAAYATDVTNEDSPSFQGAQDAQHAAELEQLQEQIKQTREQLQSAKARLEALKERERQYRKRQKQLENSRKHLQDLQQELQATQAELEATESRVASYQGLDQEPFSKKQEKSKKEKKQKKSSQFDASELDA